MVAVAFEFCQTVVTLEGMGINVTVGAWLSKVTFTEVVSLPQFPALSTAWTPNQKTPEEIVYITEEEEASKTVAMVYVATCAQVPGAPLTSGALHSSTCFKWEPPVSATVQLMVVVPMALAGTAESEETVGEASSTLNSAWDEYPMLPAVSLAVAQIYRWEETVSRGVMVYEAYDVGHVVEAVVEYNL